MSYPPRKRRPPFVTLPRHKRSHEVIRLKGKMCRDAAEYGGRFTSRLVLNEPGRAASLIVLHEFAGPFGCNGSTAYGDHLFEYMRRA